MLNKVGGLCMVDSTRPRYILPARRRYYTFKMVKMKFLNKKIADLKQVFCRHEWQFIGRRDAKFCMRDFIYECQKCNKYELTQTRKKEALNDIILGSNP
jgi:hypothetical protein